MIARTAAFGLFCAATIVFVTGCEFVRKPDAEEEKIPVLAEDPWRDPAIGPVPTGKLRIEEFSNGRVFYLSRDYRKLMPEAMDMIVYNTAYMEVRNVRFRGILNDFNNARMKADKMIVRVRELPDGRRNIARVIMSGDVKFSDDRDQTASGPLEIDFETSTLTAEGRHKALMSR